LSVKKLIGRGRSLDYIVVHQNRQEIGAIHCNN
jgi:hypothetical protein